MKKYLYIACIIFINNTVFSQTWSTWFGDTLQHYYSPDNPIVIDNINVFKNRLMIFGNFVGAGSLPLYLVAKWHNNIWENPGMSFFGSNTVVYTSFATKNTLYAGGIFHNNFNNMPNAQGVVYYDGNQWHNLDSINYSLYISDLFADTNLYICGNFDNIHGIAFNKVARWDGQQWHKLKNGFTSYTSMLYCINKFSGNLYFGGEFDQYDNGDIWGITRWDGVNWNSVGKGFGGGVACLLKDTVTNILYAGGQLVPIDDTLSWGYWSGVASWDGTQWHSMGKVGWSAMVNKLIMYRGELYAGGGFDTLGVPVKHFAKWNGTNWVSVGSNFDWGVNSMCIYNDELIVAGGFSQAGGIHAQGLARLYMPPDSACVYFIPTIYTDADTFYLHNDTVSVPFFNNNSHANSWQWDFGDTGTDTVWCPVHIYHQPGVFNVTVHVTELWCNKTAQKTIVILQGTNVNNEQRLTNADLRIYPNPANSNFTAEIFIPLIERSRNERAATFCIFGLMGEVKREYKLQ
ncbi:MAG: PKD domain-containing protein, partial [Bacteroidia bacterium]|nr:PKD domain-containing protein [Bacteroidia bacterium]